MSYEPRLMYDVFLCFRGIDTRYTFASSLNNALRQKRIRTFMDQREMKSGDPMSPAYYRAIEESRISVVVLSQNFAFSTWRLDELTLILECNKRLNQLVLPIFYDVDPSDVRNQTGTYAKAMTYLRTRTGSSSSYHDEKVHRWSLALSQVADLTGFHFKIGEEYEYEVIEKITEWITKAVTRYDVYLSFSGKDTRCSFTGYLYNALSREGFKTIMKDQDQDHDDDVDVDHKSSQDHHHLVVTSSVEKSRLSIIVLSEKYAFSSSCLDELVTILELMKTKNKLVWPIFYKVDPSDIRHQRGSYGIAMTQHETKFGKDSQKVKAWRLALSQVANLKGWHWKFGYEHERVENIVETAIKFDLGRGFQSLCSIDD